MSCTDPLHWHILGAGAMGCLFASKLQQQGIAVTLLLREHCEAGSAEVLVEAGQSLTRLTVPVSSAADSGHISRLLVTTKAQDVCTAVASLGSRLDRASDVLLLVNGLGFADELAATQPAPCYYFGTTTEGAYRIAPRHVRHAGRGETRVGRPGLATPPAWFSRWSEAISPGVWDPHIDHALWLKLAINCAVNPLTALHRCRNGELATARFETELDALCHEIALVSAAAGYAAATADLRQRVDRVVRATAENRSSMLQDVLAGRSTEIHYLTGYLLRRAAELGVAAPCNERLYRSIIALES
jgi:2-dehydropantoate 2-reductase